MSIPNIFFLATCSIHHSIICNRYINNHHSKKYHIGHYIVFGPGYQLVTSLHATYRLLRYIQLRTLDKFAASQK